MIVPGKKPLSLIVLVFLSILITCLSICHYRSNDNIKGVITWDVFGYYLYLPAAFIHDDITLQKAEWVYEAKAKYHTTITLYQLIKGEGDKWVIIFTMGLAILYAPFFFLSHAGAHLLGYPADGFSVPYQWGILCCGLFYTLIGLFVLRKVLLHFFNEIIVCLLLLLLLFGTNYFRLTVFEGTIAHNFMFTLNTLTLLFTIRWHETRQLKHALLLGFFAGLATMSRPIEIALLLAPLLWGVYNYQTLAEKVKMLVTYKWHLLGFLLFFCAAGIPQMLYWKATTGHFMYYTYENRFNFSNPNLLKILFSYKKGWLLYTPLMAVSIAGFVFLFRYNRKIFIPALVTFFLVLYVYSSYEEWWFAGSFSSRVMMDIYPLMVLPLGYFLRFISEQKKAIKIIAGLILSLLVALNLFQIWQYNNNILDHERMTKAYYWKVFGRTFTTTEYQDLLEVERYIEPVEHLKKEYKFNKKQLALHDFEYPATALDSAHFSTDVFRSGTRSFRLDSSMVFSPGVSMKYSELTPKEYAWIRASLYVYPQYHLTENPASLVVTFENNGKSYKYRALDLDTLKLKTGQWNKVSMDYLTPIIKSRNDLLKVYIWHRGQKPLYIDDFIVEVFEPKK